MKKMSKRIMSLLLSLIMAVTMLPSFTFTAQAAMKYAKTGEYNFTSSVSGVNAVAGYTGSSFIMKAKAWDSGLGVQDGTLSNIDSTFDCVLHLNKGETTSVSYAGGTTNVTLGISGLYVHDGLIYIDNINDYLGTTGFKISWTEQYFSKSSADGAGVFSLGTTNNGDILKWTSNDNKLYEAANEANGKGADSGTVYDITLTSDVDKKINVLVKNHATSDTVINYTTSGTYAPTSIKYLVIGSCDQGSNSLGTFALNNLTIEKGYETDDPDDEPPTANADKAKKNIDNVKKTYDNIYVTGADATIMNGIVSGTLGGNVQTKITPLSGEDTYHYSNVYSLTNGVALYTGNNSDIKIPVTYAHLYGKVDGTNTALTRRYLYTGVDHISMNVSNFALGQEKWERCTGWDNLTYYDNDSEHTNLDFYSDGSKGFDRSEGKNGYSDHRFEERTGTSNNKYWRNYIKYTGSGNTDTYYDELTTPTFNYQADYVYSYFQGTSWRYSNNSNYAGTFKTGWNIYVLNFEPLLKIMKSSDFKTNFETIYNDRWMYDDTARENYFDVMAEITTFDITTYPMTNKNEISQVAKKIKDLVTRYKNYEHPAKKKFTVTFRNSDDSATISEKTIEAGNSIGALPDNSKATKIEDSNQHIVYSWQSDINKDTVPRGNKKYCEIATTQKHTSNDKGTPTFEIIKDGETERTLQKHEKTCTVCGAKYTELHNLEIDDNKDASCSCGYKVVSDYKSNGFRITKGNLFDFDAYAANKSANISPSQGTVSVDTVNDTITVAGSAYDAYTYYGATSDYYRIPVSELQWYTISYKPSNDSNQVYAFFSDGVNYLNHDDDKKIWNAHMYDAPVNEEYKLKFQAPADCTHVDFRFGTVDSGSICTFSDISFYECDESGKPTNGYEVLKGDAQKDSKVLESLGIPSADKCNAFYDMYNNRNEITPDDTISTNLNISLDTEHNYPNSLVIDGNKATITCSDCNYSYTLDLTAYKAAVTDANASINNSAAYTPDSIKDLSDVLSAQANALKSAKTQDDVNACTAAIVTANKIKDGDNGGLLEYLTYNVTFIIQNGTSSKPVIVNEPHHYGDIVNMNVDEGNVYKWTKTTINSENEPVEIKYADNATSTSYVVHENATIIAYLSPEQEASTNNVKIILKDKTDRISGIAYATNGTITLYDTYIAVGDTKLYSKSVTYYNAKGYTINGVVVSGEYAIPEGVTEIVLRPIYIAGSTFQIDCDAATSINGKNVTSYQAKWDEPITIKASGEVIWYTKSGDKEIILAQGDTYKFRANESIKIYTKDVPQTNVAPSAKIGYFDYDVELNKVTVVNNFFVPSGMTVKSAGVILSTKTNDIETLKKQTNGHFSVTPDKFTENGNQVRISVSRTANNAFTMHALAYVEFQDGTVCYADEIATCQYSPKQA